MKKKLTAAFILILSATGGVYLFIPNIVTLKSSITIEATQQGLHRALLDKKNTANWWPGTVSKDSFYLNNRSYSISNNNISLLPVLIGDKGGSIKSSIVLVSLKTEVTRLEWIGATTTSYNPVKRFFAYLKAKQINNDMDAVLKKMEKHFSDPDNIYGCHIEKALVVDATLINTFGECKDYPSTAFIYSMVNKLKGYAIEQKAQITSYPMLNIQKTDSATYFVKVALPLDKMIPAKGDILQKQMLKDGNILVTEIKGGINKTTEAYNQILNYSNDHLRTMPAIPFYSLITDRAQETDSSKWVTKIYCPVM